MMKQPQRRGLRLFQGARKFLEIERGFGHADGMRVLHSRRGRSRQNIQTRNAPMRRHLAPAGIGIVLGSHGLKEHFQRRNAQRQAKRAITIVGIHPIVAGTNDQSCGGQNTLVPRAADLEKSFVLPF